MEELRLKLSPDGRIGFEVTEKTGTSKGREVETSSVEWLVWRLGGKRECRELVLEARHFHIVLQFPPPLVASYPVEQTGEWRLRDLQAAFEPSPRNT